MLLWYERQRRKAWDCGRSSDCTLLNSFATPFSFITYLAYSPSTVLCIFVRADNRGEEKGHDTCWFGMGALQISNVL